MNTAWRRSWPPPNATGKNYGFCSWSVGKDYTYRLAEILEERHLLEGADLYGVAADSRLITTAEEFSRMSKPPRPYLKFFLHDLHTPLENSPALRNSGSAEASFDFIIVLGAIGGIYDAQSTLGRIYQNNLKPGGVIYLWDFVLTQGETGWISPHPSIDAYGKAGTTVIASYNPGVMVAEVLGDWLREFGASRVQSYKHVFPAGGKTEQGRNYFRANVLSVRLNGPHLIKAGLMTQAEYDEIIRVIFNELTQEMVGQGTYWVAIALKP